MLIYLASPVLSLAGLLRQREPRAYPGGSWGARDPPLLQAFLIKQPRTGGENAMTFQLENVQTNEYPHFDTV